MLAPVDTHIDLRLLELTVMPRTRPALLRDGGVLICPAGRIADRLGRGSLSSFAAWSSFSGSRLSLVFGLCMIARQGRE
jgi:hypothetical protein